MPPPTVTARADAAEPGAADAAAPGTPTTPVVHGSDRVPARADGIELLGAMPGSGYSDAPSLVRRTDGQTLQLTTLLYSALESLDGTSSYDDAARRLGEAVDRSVSAQDLHFLVENKLRPLGVLVDADGEQPVAAPRANPLLALRFRVVMSNPESTRRVTAPFARLFLPLLALPLLAAFVASTWWVLFHKGLASATHEAFFTPGLLLTVFGLTVLSAGFHEFGHAAACRYGGATPGAMGFGLYIVSPAFYTDVTDAYRLDRRHRLWVDLGGLYFNAIFGVLAYGLWALTRWDALLLLIGTQLLQMLRQLAPFVRADGYHIIADLIGVPDLFAHIRPTLASVIPWMHAAPGSAPLKRWARIVVITWVAVVVPVLLCTLVLGAVMLPRVVATTWAGLGRQAGGLGHDLSAGDVLDLLKRLLGMLALALPVAGTMYMIVRIVRGTATKVWRSTAGRPRHRAGAAAVAALVLVGLAWAWWPGAQYQQVQPGERWTLGRLVSAQARLPEAGATTLVPAGSTQAVTSGVSQPALLLVPRQVPGQPRRPALVMMRTADGRQRIVSVPAATDGSDRWPFPFPSAGPAGPGGNRAVAITTTDGSAVYDTAFALVWVDGGQPVLNRNDAVALASCRDCSSVAVAFQAVFIIGENHVAVPVNTAQAETYQCLRCRTTAVAVQLVATLTALPDQQVMDQLAVLWKQLDVLRADLPHLSAAEVSARLASLESDILGVLSTAGPVIVTSAPPATPGAATGGATASAAPSVAPSPGTSTAPATEQPSPGGTTPPSAGPSAEPTPAAPGAGATTGPSATPTPDPTTSPATG